VTANGAAAIPEALAGATGVRPVGLDEPAADTALATARETGAGELRLFRDARFALTLY